MGESTKAIMSLFESKELLPEEHYDYGTHGDDPPLGDLTYAKEY